MDVNLVRHNFADGEELAEALAEAVGSDLAAAIKARGNAVLAVSGGVTPKRFLIELGRRAVDWSKVMVTLVDDRWVEATDERSNERLVRENLLCGRAAAASFTGLHVDVESPEQGLDEVRRKIASLSLPFDAAVIGMGADGHTASYFPGGDALAEAINPVGKHLVVALRAEGANEPRITLTLPVLLAARSLYLHIEGAGRARVLEAALGDGPIEEMPIRAVLRNVVRPLAVYYAPQG
ncbi:MAG: 6-phosphogluconolactonase [Rhodospirillales bacterium RIFCSPLOWO2_12_FULL_58_28]|nr:MAG: 6-phosphogluconolactonase [Rhodospirillales bacterium RIFCSPLOWO2_02_FULL_58_16]OHC78715.1 MAG: 6-phosphogluconolactonase [Rhodospirillales bacterium RIFCSPLOWO2_12_FULL_58_28]